jgi:hypothetical protein
VFCGKITYNIKNSTRKTHHEGNTITLIYADTERNVRNGSSHPDERTALANYTQAQVERCRASVTRLGQSTPRTNNGRIYEEHKEIRLKMGKRFTGSDITDKFIKIFDARP